MHPIEKYMNLAIEEAKKSAKQGQYALGAVIVLDDKVLSIAHTTLHETNDPSAHAEMNAIREAANKIGSRYLKNAWLYSTQEPCPMCTSAAIWAKLEGIVFGAYEKDAIQVFKGKKECQFTWRQIEIPCEYIIEKGEPKLGLHKGFMRDECIKLYELNE